jgi:Cu/Ag efflux pump CusA
MIGSLGGVLPARRGALDLARCGSAGGASDAVRALAAVWLRGMEDDVYFQVGLITLVGLSAKNSVLIFEFAARRQAEGERRPRRRLRRCVCDSARS